MTQSAKALRSAAEVVDAGLAAPSQRVALDAVAARYAVAISPTIAALIDPADPADPLARQFVPDAAELVTTPAERADPIGDDAHSPVEGIVHRYPDRVLLKLVHVCPVYCRYCFRREMVGPRGRGTLSPQAVQAALAYIRANTQIWEVILTGGEPLLLSARRLRAVMRELAALAHVKVLRVHTRTPVVAPERVTGELVRALKAAGKATYVVVHVNHARELSGAARAACARFIDAGVPVLSQSVLLRGVNDDAASLEALLRALVECRIKPYYLHQGDLAPGTAHLRTSIAEGQGLMRELRGRLSGIAQPTYVLDIPGGAGKVPIGPCYLTHAAEDRYRVEDPLGCKHLYPPSEDL
ncbi:MAG TPA: lysine-2,3-aminomutase-like protein [Xanthobacteraceae bacterium]|nr:lysine-2,3-aminomutase-like protein [Xanthobacteraceae bacterium]